MTEHCAVSQSQPIEALRPAVQQEQALPQPRVLTTDEVKAVAGGPTINNEA